MAQMITFYLKPNKRTILLWWFSLHGCLEKYFVMDEPKHAMGMHVWSYANAHRVPESNFS